jgi:signal transduction histidine kinase
MNVFLIFLISFLILAAIGLLYLALKRYRMLRNIEAARYHIARDLHDDIGATLSSISFYTQALRQQVISGDTGKTLDTLERVGSLSREMMDSMSDIVWMVNPENDTSEKFFERIDEYGASLFASRNITFMFYADPDVHAVTFDMYKRKEFFLVCKEAMNNAAKYAGCSVFEILITKKGNNITTVIKDNGKGFDEQQIRPGNGLLNMKVRVTNLGGKLEIRSQPGTTLSFQFEIPPKW